MTTGEKLKSFNHQLNEELQHLLFVKDRTMDNVQNCDSYINIPSSQTYT
jgi:hypothetical protein